jgi:membrane-bound lytic murein transglycosylase A
MSQRATPTGNSFPRDLMTQGTPIVAGYTCQRIAYDALSRWADDDHGLALQTFRQSAGLIGQHPLNFAKQPTFAGWKEDWRPAVEASANSTAEKDPRGFFENNFIPCQISDAHRPNGLFTGYFEPVVHGSRNHGPDFPVPVYGKPRDLVAFDAAETQSTGLAFGKRNTHGPQPYDTRQEIENGSLSGQGLEICWLSNWIDAYFMHIQGSGRVQLDDGTPLRLGYAAKSGRPYVAIGSVLLNRGLISRENLSMQSLMAWMRTNPAESRHLMWQNPSYIFFREVTGIAEDLGAMGAGKVQLVPQRSLAIDANHYLYGTPLWLETTTPPEATGGVQTFDHLMIAQDTGSAIRGLLRGDVYWGWGEEAARIAGHMKSPGRMTALLPVPVAQRLGLPP